MENCSKCGKLRDMKHHHWCRSCFYDYMREARSNGKWVHDSNEYKCIRVGGKTIKEHIYEAEKHLGRVFLRKLGCYVHHKDGNFRNNEWKNLELVTPEEHYRIHRCGT